MTDELHNEKPKVSYKDTLNLPRTDFPIRPNAVQDDPILLARWQEQQLYAKASRVHEGSPSFILHDGPPYANGHIHLGHAYNKILKDIVTKARRMMGNHVLVVPGWDCHGLPIEIKVTQENPGLTGSALKKKCREYARHWIDTQRQEFKKLGVVMEWDKPYLTMDPAYEAAVIRVFGDCVERGYIERKNKTVPWCPSCQTVLAIAEIEYQDRKDPSIYVEFPLQPADARKLLPDVSNPQISFLVWTTTPWTLPLNRAVMLRPHTEYALIEHQGRYLMVGAALAHTVCQLASIECTIKRTIKAEQLEGLKVQHPFIAALQVPVLFDDFVSLDDGTAVVHCAPGCGPQDYDVAIKNNLEIFSPLSTDGKYTVGIQPGELEGMPIMEGQKWVLRTLVDNGRLFLKKSITHPFPHCWRCHNPLMFRATKQWFCDLEHANLKERALQAIETIDFFPVNARNSLRAALENRLEWCLSRQRVWGVPIPALRCTSCDKEYVTPELIKRVAQGVKTQGIEFWDTVSVKQLVDTSVKCSCGKQSWEKEQDILDVWFDAGVSHYAVLCKAYGLTYPADMYLEGRDQTRGWFQSSLLTSLILHEAACMRAIVMHGYTVDEHGRKMSKSIGNVVSPQELINKLGTDGLRLWVSSIDYADDAIVSETLVKNVQETYRKIRNTCRFLLSNLYDFTKENDAVPLDKLPLLDAYALSKARALDEQCRAYYQQVNFTGIYHALNDFCAVFLSALYLDIVKDRLYIEKANGYERRSAQTTCWYLLDILTRTMAPILSFTAELISDEYQRNKQESIHLQLFAPYSAELPLTASYWELLHTIREALLKAIEEKRAQGLIKHSLEAALQLHLSLDKNEQQLLDQLITDLRRHNQTLASFIKEWMIVSQVTIADDANTLPATIMPGLSALVTHAAGVKCPRCWQWSVSDHPQGLDKRCQQLV